MAPFPTPLLHDTGAQLPVYVPSAAERADARLFADGVRAAMLAAGGLAPSPATLADCRAYLALARGRPADMPAHSRAGRALAPGANLHPSPNGMKDQAGEGAGRIEICVDARADAAGALGPPQDMDSAHDGCEQGMAGAWIEDGCSSAPAELGSNGAQGSCERAALLAPASQPGWRVS